MIFTIDGSKMQGRESPSRNGRERIVKAGSVYAQQEGF